MNAFRLFLLELAITLQFSSLEPDSHGACLIIMKEGKTPLLFEFDEQLVPNTILLSSALSPIPMTHRSEIYEAILINNCKTESTLSVKPDEEVVYLHCRFHPHIQATDLEFLLQKFLDTVKKWNNQIDTILKNAPRSQKNPSHPSMIQVFPYKA